MARDLPLNAVAYFEAVARHSHLTLAAHELGVSPSAVSQQIRLLEERLGVCLFRRLKRKLILTEEGELFYLSASEALTILRNARDRLGRKISGRQLTVRIVSSLGIKWLGPRLHRFIRNHADAIIHIDATPEQTDFEKENIDLEIRHGNGDWPNLFIEPILGDIVMPLCSPSYLTHFDHVSIDTLQHNATLLQSVKSFVRWSDWFSLNNVQVLSEPNGPRFDRSLMTIQAAKDGVGIALESAMLAFEELKEGSLVPFLPQSHPVIRAEMYWFTCPRRNINRRMVLAFHEWIREEARQHEIELADVLKSFGLSL